MYQWSIMKTIHSPNLVGIGPWGPEIWLHEYLISPTEIGVNWLSSKQLWTRPIYMKFNWANLVFMRPYLGPPWTNSCQIWCVRVFHHVLLKYGHENAEMQNENLMTSHFNTLCICQMLMQVPARILCWAQTFCPTLYLTAFYGETWNTKEYWSVMSSNFLFCISAFSWPYFSRTWWKTLTHQIWHELVHGGPRYGRMNI